MTTYKELVYMVLDEIKAKTDDFYYTEDHIIFLIDKYRAFLLKQKYKTPKSVVLNSNYMYIQIPNHIITDNKIFTNFKWEIISIGVPRVLLYPIHPDQKEHALNYCTEERRYFLRQSQFLKNINYFYFLNNELVLDLGKSFFTTYKDVETVIKVKAVFESPSKLYTYINPSIDVLEQDIPLEESLISPLLEMVVKDLTSAMFKPEDDINNGKDETGDLNKFMYQNSKSDLQKQIYG